MGLFSKTKTPENAVGDAHNYENAEVSSSSSASNNEKVASIVDAEEVGAPKEGWFKTPRGKKLAIAAAAFVVVAGATGAALGVTLGASSSNEAPDDETTTPQPPEYLVCESVLGRPSIASSEGDALAVQLQSSALGWCLERTLDSATVELERCEWMNTAQHWFLDNAGTVRSAQGECISVLNGTLSVAQDACEDFPVTLDPSGVLTVAQGEVCLEVDLIAREIDIVVDIEGDCQSLVQTNGTFVVTAPAPMQLEHIPSGLCLSHDGLDSKLSLKSCQEAQSWVLRDGQMQSDGNLCVDASGGREPSMARCVGVDADQDDRKSQQMWFNQYGRFASANGQCMVVDPETLKISFYGYCQATDETQRFTKKAAIMQVQVGCNNDQCLTHDLVSASGDILLSLSTCSAERIDSQSWSLLNGRLSVKGHCVDAAGGSLHLSPCSTGSNSQVVDLSGSKLKFPKLNWCVSSKDLSLSEQACAEEEGKDGFSRVSVLDVPSRICNSSDTECECSSSAPCGEGEGRCSTDDDCAGDMQCGVGSCRLFGWGTDTDNCCVQPDPAACYASSFDELELQVRVCPTGVISILEDIVWTRVINIPIGKKVRIQSVEEFDLNYPGRTDKLHLSMPAAVTDRSYLFRVAGELSLNDLIVQNKLENVVDGTMGSIARAQGVNGSLVIDNCDFDSEKSPVRAVEEARVHVIQSSLLSEAGEGALKGCAECEVALDKVQMKIGLQPQVSGAKYLDLSDLRLSLDDSIFNTPDPSSSSGRRLRVLSAASGLSDQVETLEIRDMRKYYASYLNCSESATTLLGESFPTDDPVKCVSECDKQDDCHGLFWQLNATNTSEVFSRCFLYEDVDTDGCVPLETEEDNMRFDLVKVVTASHQYSPGIRPFKVNALGNVIEEKMCIEETSALVQLQDVDNAQACRIWCKYYSPMCRAVEYDATQKDCILGTDVQTYDPAISTPSSCLGNSNPELLPPLKPLELLGVNCKAEATFSRGMFNATAEACGTSCQLAGENCAAIEFDPLTRECHFLTKTDLYGTSFEDKCRPPQGVDASGYSYQFLVSRHNDVVEFPRREFLADLRNLQGYCPVALDMDIPPMNAEIGTTTFDSCLERCAAEPGCVAVEPRRKPVGQGSGYLCYFKRSAAFKPCGLGETSPDYFFISRSTTSYDVQLINVSDATIDQVIEDAVVEPKMSFDGCRFMCYLDNTCGRFVYDGEKSLCIAESTQGAGIPTYAGDFVIQDGETVYEEREEQHNATFSRFVFYPGQRYLFGEMTLQMNEELTEEADCALYCVHNVQCKVWYHDTSGVAPVCRMYRGLNVDSAVAKLDGEVPAKISTLQFRYDGAAEVQREYPDMTGRSSVVGEPLETGNLGLWELQGEFEAEECMLLCETFRGCNAFLFEDGTCSLYKGAVDNAYNASLVNFQVFVAESLYEFEAIPNTVCPIGASILLLEETTLEQCKKACKEVTDGDRCGSFEYDFSEAQCELFRGSQLQTGCSVPSTKTVFVDATKFVDEIFSFLPVAGGCPAEGDKAIFSALEDRSLDRCERACEMEEDTCKGFIFNANENSCKLLDSAAYKLSGCQLGEGSTMQVKYEADKFTLESDRCPKGNKLVEFSDVDQRLCGVICDSLLECVAFTMDGLTSCSLYDSTWSVSTKEGQCAPTQFFVAHSSLFFTEDKGTCGGNPIMQSLENKFFTLDECKALCNAKHRECHGFNYDRAAMKCSLQGPLADATCSTLMGAGCSCGQGFTPGTTTLYVSFRHSAKEEYKFKFVAGRACHGPSVTTREESTASLDKCKELCALDPTCRTVSLSTESRCELGQSDFTSGNCAGVYLRREIDQYGMLINVMVQENDREKDYTGKTVGECRALCEAKKDCVDVMSYCVPLADTPPTCYLSTSRDYSVSGPDENCESQKGAMDVAVHKIRFFFPSSVPSICKSRVSQVSSIIASSRDECAEACIDEDACVGFEYGSKLLMPQSSDACFTYRSESPQNLYDQANCQDYINGGQFYPRAVGQLQTLSPEEYSARVWLRDPSARVGKKLYKSVEEFKRVSTGVVQGVTSATSGAGIALGAMDGVLAAMDGVGVAIQTIVPTLQGLEFGIQLAEPLLRAIPIVGAAVSAIVKILRLVVFKPSRKSLETSNKILVKGKKKKVEKAQGILGKFDGLLSSVGGVLMPLPFILSFMSIILIQAHKCVYDLGDLELIDQVESLMEIVREVVDRVTTALRSLGDRIIKPFERFANSLSNVLGTLHRIRVGPLSIIARVLSPLKWLAKLAQFRIRIPRIRIWPGITIFPGVSLGLADLARFLAPIGWLFKWLNLEGMIVRIFPRITLVDIGLDFNIFNFFDDFLVDLDAAYEQLIEAIRYPFEQIEKLVEELREKVPDKFIPCNLGEKLSDMLTGTTDEDLEEQDLGRLLQSSTSSKYEAPLRSKDLFKQILFRLFASPSKQDDEPSASGKSNRRAWNRARQKNKLIGADKPKVKFSIAAPITVARDAWSYKLDGDGSDIPFKVSTSAFVSPIPKKTSYMRLTYKLVDHTGKKSDGPLCYMGINKKNGKPIPLVRGAKKTKQSIFSMLKNGVFSSKLLDLEFSPAGNPWGIDSSGKHGLWDITLEGTVVTSLPGGLSSDCTECPVGSKCKKTGARRQLGVAVGAPSSALKPDNAGAGPLLKSTKDPVSLLPGVIPLTICSSETTTGGKLWTSLAKGDEDGYKKEIKSFCTDAATEASLKQISSNLANDKDCKTIYKDGDRQRKIADCRATDYDAVEILLSRQKGSQGKEPVSNHLVLPKMITTDLELLKKADRYKEAVELLGPLQKRMKKVDELCKLVKSNKYDEALMLMMQACSPAKFDAGFGVKLGQSSEDLPFSNTLLGRRGLEQLDNSEYADVVASVRPTSSLRRQLDIQANIDAVNRLIPARFQSHNGPLVEEGFNVLPTSTFTPNQPLAVMNGDEGDFAIHLYTLKKEGRPGRPSYDLFSTISTHFWKREAPQLRADWKDYLQLMFNKVPTLPNEAKVSPPEVFKATGGGCFRGRGFKTMEDKKNGKGFFSVGQEYLARGFWSCTGDITAALAYLSGEPYGQNNKFGELVFIQNTGAGSGNTDQANARYVRPLSASPFEDEYLFLPMSKFEVVSIKEVFTKISQGNSAGFIHVVILKYIGREDVMGVLNNANGDFP